MARKRRSTTRRRRRRAAPRRRRRRRNAGITRFTANPRMARRYRAAPRRRRAANPMGRLTMKNIVNKTMYLGAGSAIGAGANILAINKIENVWARNGTRVGAAVLGSILLRGVPTDVSASAAGALLYPMWQEVYARVMSDEGGGGGSEPSEADLDYLGADLDAAMGDARF